jgi:hypothetical protein
MFSHIPKFFTVLAVAILASAALLTEKPTATTIVSAGHHYNVPVFSELRIYTDRPTYSNRTRQPVQYRSHSVLQHCRER